MIGEHAAFCIMSWCLVPLRDGGVIYLYNEAVTFDDARVKCKSLDLDLVTVDEEMQTDFTSYALSNLVNNDKNSFWIGLQLDEWQKWRWMGGELVNWTFWIDRTKIEDITPQNCAVMSKTGEAYPWQPRSCRKQFPCLCQKPEDVGNVTSDNVGESNGTQNQTDAVEIDSFSSSSHMSILLDVLQITTSIDNVLLETSMTVAATAVAHASETPVQNDFSATSRGTRTTHSLEPRITMISTSEPPSSRKEASSDWQIDWESTKIDKHQTTMYKRKFISVYDSRLSATGIGITAIVVIIMVITGIVIFDVDNINKSFRLMRKNLKSRCC